MKMQDIIIPLNTLSFSTKSSAQLKIFKFYADNDMACQVLRWTVIAYGETHWYEHEYKW